MKTEQKEKFLHLNSKDNFEFQGSGMKLSMFLGVPLNRGEEAEWLIYSHGKTEKMKQE